MAKTQVKRPDTPLANTVYPSVPKKFTDSLDKARGNYTPPKPTTNKNIVSVGRLKQVRDSLMKSSTKSMKLAQGKNVSDNTKKVLTKSADADSKKAFRYDQIITKAPKKQVNLKEVKVSIPLKEVKVTAKAKPKTITPKPTPKKQPTESEKEEAREKALLYKYL
jgi:hypothetical protein